MTENKNPDAVETRLREIAQRVEKATDANVKKGWLKPIVDAAEREVAKLPEWQRKNILPASVPASGAEPPYEFFREAEYILDHYSRSYKDKVSLGNRLERTAAAQTAALREENARLKAFHESAVEANLKRITELGLAYDEARSEWKNASAEAAETRAVALEAALREMLSALPSQCDCHPDWKNRKLRDPHCQFCEYKREIEAANALLTPSATGEGQ